MSNYQTPGGGPRRGFWGSCCEALHLWLSVVRPLPADWSGGATGPGAAEAGFPHGAGGTDTAGRRSLREDSPEAHNLRHSRRLHQQPVVSLPRPHPGRGPTRGRQCPPAVTGAPGPSLSTRKHLLRPVCRPSRGWVLPVTNGKRIRKYWTSPWPGRDPLFPGSPLRFLSRLWNRAHLRSC